jgi:16S rRNA (uracil1498-N3)-methyltransferase
MSTTFFYHAQAALHSTIEFDSSEATHIAKALRLKSGDKIELTNGKGGLFTAELHVVKHHVSASVVEEKNATDIQSGLHLGIAPTKNADRIEWLVEKAVELGVGEVSLIHCAHSERSRFSLDRIHRVAIAALKQSRRTYLPEIRELQEFSHWITKVNSTHRFIAHCIDSMPRELLKHVLSDQDSVCIAIGPEGDFAESEVRSALNAGFKSVSLGSARLRTETAALAAVHTYSLHHQK